MNKQQEAYQSLPAVNTLLELPEVALLVRQHGRELITFAMRSALDHFRAALRSGTPPPNQEQVLSKTKFYLELASCRSLKRVINATGIIIHTNLGRVPFGKDFIEESMAVLLGYNNLEFDLKTGTRGHRNDHAKELLKFITGAEDVLIVNNNAAAVMLILRAFAKDREVIVSRGELVEIGGSFRVPEIMAASDCIMKEVGTTNKTRLQDFENAMGSNTALLFKAHKSNYTIRGFTEEVSLKDLTTLGKAHDIPVIYDLGSGLLRPSQNALFSDEPCVRQALDEGCDLVTFSGDKLLGGPQAGVIAGRADLISKLKNNPMLRALRVDKLTLAFLETACMSHLQPENLRKKNLLYRMAGRSINDLRKTAEMLQKELRKSGMETEIVPSQGRFGGGSLPDVTLESFSVMIINRKSNKQRSDFAEKMYFGLLSQPLPVLSILKKGHTYFDVLTIFDDEVDELARVISRVSDSLKSKDLS